MPQKVWLSLIYFPAIFGAIFVNSGRVNATEDNFSILANSTIEATVATEITTTASEAIEETTNSPVFYSQTPFLNNEEIEQIPQVNQLQENQLPPTEEFLNLPDSNSMEQITNVNQLRDVSPSDWAYEALRNLVNNYGCIQGYPDGTFRGNRALTRYEFAAGLNACLEVLAARIREGGGTTITSSVTEEDLVVLRRLIQEFEAELATLGTRVDDLEARVAFLEDNQFSTTTKLAGEVIVGVADAFGEDVGDDVNTVLHDRVRLNFLTSFTGRDLLQTRLQAGNAELLLPGTVFDDGSSATQEGRFTYDGSNGNDVIIDILRYRFPLGDRASVELIANNGLHHYYVDTVNPFFEGRAGGENAISRFAERNPIYRIGPFGAGAALAYRPSNSIRLDLGYISNEAEDPSEGAGLFNGNYSAIAQLVFGTRYKLGLTYVHAYDGTSASDFPNRFVLGGTGTAYANLNPAQLSNVTELSAAQLNTPVVSNSYGIEASLGLSPNFIINGWVGLTDARLVGLGDARILNFAVNVGFPNFGGEGNLLGFVGGAAPTLIDLEIPGDEDFEDDLAFHVEAFYKMRVSDNISITPGVIWLPSPNQNASNSDIFIGTLRTTFRF
ncbi:iron uptake porin [Oscillatoria salina]|uniref:iron uptake porin n=1 Tax=Oscillatoria salina TaxID=331517 RepID=UPI001CC92013|nr:iron uptake porin [Oscillatoria salina]MBZ8179378.1 iron uptake porin [Oscillatoria salina IIICB1]